LKGENPRNGFDLKTINKLGMGKYVKELRKFEGV
jgi:hypothetical protein